MTPIPPLRTDLLDDQAAELARDAAVAAVLLVVFVYVFRWALNGAYPRRSRGGSGGGGRRTWMVVERSSGRPLVTGTPERPPFIQRVPGVA